MSDKDRIPVSDRFEILEQLNLHQRRIDSDASRNSADLYIDLYWPEATFTVHDLRSQTFSGPEGLKQLYDYAHSVFPIGKWCHQLGTFVIEGAGHTATAEWRWIVNWKAERDGVVSTGIYNDKFEKRDGRWKCLERISHVDPNWPAALFASYADQADARFKSS